MDYFFEQVVANWPVWFVTVALVVAAVIDGIQLKVPNWLTFPFIISGWAYSMYAYGLEGEGWIERRTASEDHRAVGIWLTDAGRELYEDTLPFAVEHWDQFTDGISKKEAKSLEGRLSNANFVERAKPEAVEKAKADFAHHSAEVERLEGALARLG